MSKTGSLISKLLAFLPAVSWAGFIFILSAQQVLPSLSMNTFDFIFKKSAHIFVYGVLFILLFQAFNRTTSLKGNRVWLVPLALTLAYAAFDELHQSYVPSRTGTFRDIGFDALGCSLVLMRKFGYI